MSKKTGGIIVMIIMAIYGAICAWICFDLSMQKIKQRIAAKIACRDWEEADEYYKDENGEWHSRNYMDSEFETE